MKRLFLTTILIGVVVLAGCNKQDALPNTPTLTTPSNPAVTNASGQPVPELSSIPNYGGLLSTIQYDYSTPAYQGIPSYTVTFKLGFAQFGNGVDVGTVTVVSDTLPKHTDGLKIYYMNNFTLGGTGLTSVEFSNGSVHNWTISGGGGIPPITSGLYTITPVTFAINSPSSGENIVKANGLNINWTNANPNGLDSILIVIVGKGGSFVKSSILSGSSSSQGSYVITGSDLGTMTGTCILQVVKYRYNVVIISSKVYIVLAEIVKQETINLQ
ncbi:MAG: hypothetical protein ABR936_04330 [Bacteroidota bacterium]|jgi:hypothetical protein